jgi:alpha-L-fucosidase 2
MLCEYTNSNNSDLLWEGFLANQDLRWNKLPDFWGDGAFLGNGLLGAMVYAADGNYLAWDLGRTDVYDVQKYTPIDTDKYRVPLGRYFLKTTGKPEKFEMRLDIWNAEARAQIKTDKGSISFCTFVHANQPLIVIDLEAQGEEKSARMAYLNEYPLAPLISYTNSIAFRADELAPPSIYEYWDGTQLRTQALKAGGEFAIAMAESALEEGRRIIYITIKCSDVSGNAGDQAVQAIRKAQDIGLARLVSEHRKWWHDYYPKSFLTVPNKRVEAFYWNQIYKLGSAARNDQPMMDLMGPWTYKTCWAGMWWNLNTQLAYWPVYTGNRLELGEPLCRTLDQHVDTLVSNVPLEYREDSAMIGRASGRDLVSMNNSELCNLPWLCHNYWLQYRYSMDGSMLKDRIYPLLRRSISYYLHHIEERENGSLHLGISVSPEYHTNARDTNINLALLRWSCLTLITTAEKLELEDPLIPKLKDLQKRLAGFPVDQNGLMIGEGVPFDSSHRHYSHLLGIYPLYILNRDHEDNCSLIRKSIDHWCSLDKEFAGYSYTGAASLYAAVGDGERAYSYIIEFLDKVPVFNTMYLEHISWGGGGHTLETPLTFASSVHDMLLQSWGGKIRVFPAVPGIWNDIAFSGLRAEGAFLVNAERKEGRTIHISVTSEAGEPCIIETDMAEPEVFVNGSKAEWCWLHEGCLKVDLDAGETAVLKLMAV